MIFVDSNVVIDLISPDQDWFGWSRDRIGVLARSSDLVVDAIVVAEIAGNFPSLDELEAALERLDIEIVPLTEMVAFAAGQAFRRYRRAHRQRDAILPDFLIGSHAASLGATLLTRDSRLYRTYFPDLTLITPENDA